jgi:hypothetical protein
VYLLGSMTHNNNNNNNNNARNIIISNFLFAFFFLLLMMFYFGFCLPGIYLGKVCFLSAFCLSFLLKRYSLFIPVCDTTLSSRLNTSISRLILNSLSEIQGYSE